MDLVALAPRPFVSPWVGMPPGTTVDDMLAQRKGMGISFDCPCGCGERRLTAFANPLDGGAAAADGPTFTVAVVADAWTSLSLEEGLDFGAHGQWVLQHGEFARCAEISKT